MAIKTVEGADVGATKEVAAIVHKVAAEVAIAVVAATRVDETAMEVIVETAMVATTSVAMVIRTTKATTRATTTTAIDADTRMPTIPAAEGATTVAMAAMEVAVKTRTKAMAMPQVCSSRTITAGADRDVAVPEMASLEAVKDIRTTIRDITTTRVEIAEAATTVEASIEAVEPVGVLAVAATRSISNSSSNSPISSSSRCLTRTTLEVVVITTSKTEAISSNSMLSNTLSRTICEK